MEGPLSTFGNKAKLPALAIIFSAVLENSQYNSARIKQQHQIGKKERKLSLFVCDIIPHIKETHKRKLLE